MNVKELTNYEICLKKGEIKMNDKIPNLTNDEIANLIKNRIDVLTQSNIYDSAGEEKIVLNTNKIIVLEAIENLWQILKTRCTTYEEMKKERDAKIGAKSCEIKKDDLTYNKDAMRKAIVQNFPTDDLTYSIVPELPEY